MTAAGPGAGPGDRPVGEDRAAPTVTGIVVARNEWPLVGVAVSHALEHHVDAVCVIDHASNDGTAAGLSRLAAHWGPRLRVYRWDDDAFLQEALTAAAIELSADLGHSWIHVFDADEFLLAPATDAAPGGLRDVLATMPEAVDAVRYAMDHHVAPRDFDTAAIGTLDRFRWRIAHRGGAMPPLDALIDSIERGERSFFDVPFLPKVVVRRREGTWIGAGAHRLWGAAEARARRRPRRPALHHLTYPSLRRLHLKAAIGANKIRNGFPRDHGWQNQVLARLAAAGDLDAYWRRHSIGPDGHLPLGPGTVLLEDDAFATSVARSLAILERLPDAADDGPAAATIPPRALAAALRTAIDNAHRIRILARRLEGKLRKASRATPDIRHAGADRASGGGGG